MRNINIFVGSNGCGKTSLLRAIAVGCIPGLPLDRLARDSNPTISITYHNGESHQRKSSPFVAGFGVTRWSPPRPPKPPEPTISGEIEHLHNCVSCSQENLCKIDISDYSDEIEIDIDDSDFYGHKFARVHSLFRNNARLRSTYDLYGKSDTPNIFTMFGIAKQDNSERFVEYRREINEILNNILNNLFSIAVPLNNRDHLMVRIDGRPPIRAYEAPGGLRTTIGWLFDLLVSLSKHAHDMLDSEPIVNVKGIVLVDEIELHLHPKWQKDLLVALSQFLPKLQFFLTTHSPLVVASANPRNIWVLDVNESGESRATQTAVAESRTIDSILLGPWFKLHSTRPRIEIDHMRSLLRQAEAGDPDAPIKFLKILAGE